MTWEVLILIVEKFKKSSIATNLVKPSLEGRYSLLPEYGSMTVTETFHSPFSSNLNTVPIALTIFGQAENFASKGWFRIKGRTVKNPKYPII